MSENLLRPPQSSRTSQVSTLTDSQDHRHFFKGTVTHVNFRPGPQSLPVTIHKSTVYELVNHGPEHASDHSIAPQVRWIHLPANNMGWIQDLMTRLGQQHASARENGPSGTTSDDMNWDGVLRDDVWKDAYHGRDSAGIHSRFMTPHAARYSSSQPFGSDSEESESSNGGTSKHPNVTAIYLPYIHWETYNSWKARQLHIARLKRLDVQNGECCNCLSGEIKHLVASDIKKGEALLLHDCLMRKEGPLHDRRSLDQSYFYNMRNVAYRDEDQIIGQYTWDKARESNEGRKMMMTDQLWMWVIRDDTIITAFPESSMIEKDEVDVLQLILRALTTAVEEGQVKSLNGLVAMIIDHCTGIFHRRDIPSDLAFYEFFANVIGKAREESNSMFHDLYSTSNAIESLWTTPNVTYRQMSRELDNLFSVKAEISHVESVSKIVMDLEKIDFICSQQEEVIQNLIQLQHQTTHGGSGAADQNRKYSSINNNHQHQHQQTHSSRSLKHLYETLRSRRKAWSDMAVTANATRQSMYDLLDLKQRQTAVSEARTVRYQIEISADQGRSIMLLTLFTVFLLPISVMATIFGMNASELVGKDGGKLSFGTMSGIMFPVTVTLVVSALGFAFKERFWSVVKYWVRSLSMKLGLFDT